MSRYDAKTSSTFALDGIHYLTDQHYIYLHSTYYILRYDTAYFFSMSK